MSRKRRPGYAAAALLCCVSASVAWSQARVIGQAPASTGAVELVVFDMLALGADGAPIVDLRREALTLKIDGRPREVRSLELVRLAPALTAGAAAMLPPPFATNRAHSGRTVLIVFNHDSIRPGKERQAVEGAMRFVESLSPGDRVGLLTMPNGHVEQEMTTDRARVMASLRRVTGQASAHASESDKSCMTRLTLETLTGVLESMSIVPGPKTIAFVSSGLLTPRRDAPMTGAPGPCEIKLDHFQDVGRAASTARARFYVIQPEDFQVDSARQAFVDPTASRFRANDEALTGLSSLAGVTGGEMFRLSAQSVDSVFDRVARESSAYYLVGFEPTAAERNGSSHRVDVATGRPGVTLRARPQVVIAKANARGRSNTTPQGLLRDFRAYDELPLRVTAYASPTPGDSKLMVTAVAEPMIATDGIAGAAFGLVDSRGKLVAQWTADPRQLGSIPIIAAGLAAPGEYRLRAAAIDAAGRRGQVEFEFAARVPAAGALKTSELVLGVSRGDGFVPRLQFTSDPAAMAYLELHGAPPAGAAVTARLELARAVEGQPILAPRAHVSVTADRERRVIAGTLAIGTLPPGDYLVRAIVTVGDQPPLVATRTLRRAQP